jgi:hypothetical protein
MLSQANHEIRRFLDAADTRRRLERETELPIRYLDWVLGRLETYRLQGETRVPPAFHAMLQRTPLTLPAGVQPPRQWANRIGWAVEQCFRLQSQLLRLRRRDLGLDLVLDEVQARARVRAPAVVPSSSNRLWWAAAKRTGRGAAASPARERRQPHVYA